MIFIYRTAGRHNVLGYNRDKKMGNKPNQCPLYSILRLFSSSAHEKMGSVFTGQPIFLAKGGLYKRICPQKHRNTGLLWAKNT